MARFEPGAIVETRGRERTPAGRGRRPAPPAPADPHGGRGTGVFDPVERAAPRDAAFPLPNLDAGTDACAIPAPLDAARLSLRSGAAPFAAWGGSRRVLRADQFVPLLMALRLDPVRLLLADHVGSGRRSRPGDRQGTARAQPRPPARGLVPGPSRQPVGAGAAGEVRDRGGADFSRRRRRGWSAGCRGPTSPPTLAAGAVASIDSLRRPAEGCLFGGRAPTSSSSTRRTAPPGLTLADYKCWADESRRAFCLSPGFCGRNASSPRETFPIAPTLAWRLR